LPLLITETSEMVVSELAISLNKKHKVRYMRENMRKILVGFFVCFALFGLATAHAGTIDSGAPYPGNSTDQNWYENGVSNTPTGLGPVENITQIQMEIISGPDFDVSPSAGILNFSGGSNWRQTYEDAYGSILVADGNAFPNDLYFTTAFQTAYPNAPLPPVSFYYQGYGVNNGVMTLVDSEIITWNGSSWSYTLSSYTPGLLDPPSSAVPEPSCLLLLGGGLVGLAIFSRRFRKV
jgi:hypothetical protein